MRTIRDQSRYCYVISVKQITNCQLQWETTEKPIRRHVTFKHRTLSRLGRPNHFGTYTAAF